MTWNLNPDRPLYFQLMEKIKMDIIAGHYSCGDRLPSVRELAAEASVNPNTMQRALSELERDGLLYSQRTSGRFITEDREMIEGLKHQLAVEKITEFFQAMEQLGFHRDEIRALIQETIKEETT